MTTSQAEIDAAQLLISKMGLTPADLLDQPAPAAEVPTFSAYIPVVARSATPSAARAHGSYWAKVEAAWGVRRIDEPTPSEIKALAEQSRANALVRRNSRSGRYAVENLIAALRCLYVHAVGDGLITELQNPALQVTKPRRLPSPRRALTSEDLTEINTAAAETGDDPDLKTLLLRLHTETACRRAGTLSLRRRDLDPAECLVYLREKEGTSRSPRR
ncbi:hypothetical protein [Amycolatopsis sp. NPDC004079]|uniref:hypothetical protein n=1 Tax=Amycolatopsis sp. NPDC004079 TaxID=3154549 RepID=UPI0033BB5D6A